MIRVSLSRRKRCTDKHLDCGETVPGKEHPFTLTRMSNLAGVLSNQCKFEQTEEMHQQVLRPRETVPDRDHSDILTSINNLAMMLKDQGKYEQVEEMLRQVLRLSKTVLGKEYPNTLRSMDNLAGVLRGSGSNVVVNARPYRSPMIKSFYRSFTFRNRGVVAF